MITESPDPVEVTDFHFLQLRTLKTAKESKNASGVQGNILASASKYGLLFVGTEGGFKVIKLETILTIDEDKENRSAVESYASDFVPSGTPVVLALNGSQTILAVCVKCSTNVVINLYNLSNYSGLGKAWQPFCTNALSPPKTEVRDFVWNPAVEGWYTVCFSDGSLQIHEVTGMSVKVVGSLQGAGAAAVCWSPKGKQLVVGKENGSFTQYKPNLTEVKSIPPPAFEESPVSITSICWTANTVFAVLYVVGESMPNLFIVSTPKDSPVSYTNYYDVCLGNNCAPLQKYLIHFEPSWGMMVCASLDSIEIAVLGSMPNWVQWDIKEDGKALLPIKDGATHAVGMTVMYSAQRQLLISESESYPPMPVLLVLTNNGLLVSFHMINSNSAVPSLVCAPVSLENSTGAGEHVAGPSSSQFQSPPSNNKPLMSSTFSVGNQAAGDASASQQSKAALNLNTTQTFIKADVPAMPSVVEQKRQSSLFGDGTQKRPEEFSFSQVQKPALSSQTAPSPLHSTVEKQSDVQSETQSSYMAAIVSEIQSFEKELQDLKQLQISTPSFDGEEEILALKNSLNALDFQKNISGKMKGLSQDIYTLKNVLLESFVMVEEAISRERRRNDHSYITMLKERALDPITAKRMQKINMHYQYLNTQLQELSDKLDQDWVSLCASRKKSLKNNLGISSTEAIYKTIVSNRNTIYNLRKTVETLMKKAEERKLRNTTKSGSWGRFHKRSTQEDLSKLADEFLQVKIVNPDECEPTPTKKLSPKSQMLLKEYLKQSNVITVRPTAVYSPSQSRLLSHTIPFEDLDRSQDKDNSPKPVSVVSSNTKEVPAVISSSSEIQTPTATTPKVSLSFEKSLNQSTAKGPIYEPITPPEVVKPIIKTISVNNTPESSLLREKTPDKPLFKGIGTGDSSSSNNSDPSQVSNLNILSNIKSNVTNPPNVSSHVGGKPLAFNQTLSEKALPTSVSLFPNTLSFLQNTQQATETVISKPQIVSSCTSVSTAAPSFQFAFGPKKDISFSIASLTSTTTSAPKASSLSERAAPEGQESPKQTAFTPLSTNILNQPSSQSVGFGLPVTKTSQAPSLSFFSVPENKTVFQLPGNKEQANASLPKNSVGLTFQKISDSTTKPDASTPKQDATPETAAATQPSVLNLTSSKTDSADTKLPPPPQAPKSQTSDSVNTVTAVSSSGLLMQTVVTTSAAIQKTHVLGTSSSQPSIVNTLSNISGLKQSLSSPETPTSVPAVVSTPAAPPPVSESIQSTAQVLTSSADAAKSPSSPLSNVANVPLPPPAVSKSSFFTLPPPAVTTASLPVFSPIVTNTAPPPPPPVTTAVSAPTVFGLGPAATTVVNTATTNTGVTAAKTESTPSIFGNKAAAPVFGQASSEKPSFFGSTSIFGQTPTTQPSAPFGQTASNASFPAAGGGFFSQVPTFGTAATTSPPAPAVTTSSTDFSNQASTFSFGKPAFGQTTGSSFGLAKTFFGQNTTPSTQSATASSFSFGQSSPNTGGFFSGLGGKPSEENASKNVFGLSTVKTNTDASNLFRNSSVTSFGAVNSGSFSTSPGSFSSGGGSVAQAGFGSFQQNTTPQSAGFGASPSFGGAPAFGSPPAFGGAPAFGSGNALASVFGQQQQQQQVSSNFSNFANSSSPTFGSLASQSPPSFGNSGGFGSPQGSGFGSPFGGSSFGQQPSGFGSPGSPPSNSSAFTQWRS